MKTLLHRLTLGHWPRWALGRYERVDEVSQMYWYECAICGAPRK